MALVFTFFFVTLLQFLTLFKSVHSATKDDWRRRSVYQLMTDRFARDNDTDNSPCDPIKYCGGTYKGLINHLDWIQDMGFSAVWISPIDKGIEVTTKYGDNFHGYWGTDLLDVNEHFGTAEDIKALSDELHRRDMYLMFDIAINGFAVVGGDNFNFQTIDYSHFIPFNKQEYYHPYCPIDFSNDTSDDVCWFGDKYVALADINTDVPFVNNWFLNWIPQLISNYSVDGLRLDALKHMPAAFWHSFANASNSFTMGEYYQQNPGSVPAVQTKLTSSLACPFQQVVDGIFNYPVYFQLFNGFANSSQSLAPIAPAVLSLNTSHCADPSILGTFFENHDLTRFWNQTSDITLGKNVATITIFAEGIPFIYAGFETGQNGAYPNYNRDPVWPEQWKPTDMHTFLGTLNKVRNGIINKDGDVFLKGGMQFLYSAGNAVSFKRGNILVFVTNAGSTGADVTVVTTNTGLVSGTVLIDALSNSTVTVATGGIVSVTLTKGMPMVFYPKADWSQVTLTTKVDSLEGNNSTSTVGSSTPTGTTSGTSNSTSSKSIATKIIGGGILQWKILVGVSIGFVIGLGVL